MNGRETSTVRCFGSLGSLHSHSHPQTPGGRPGPVAWEGTALTTRHRFWVLLSPKFPSFLENQVLLFVPLHSYTKPFYLLTGPRKPISINGSPEWRIAGFLWGGGRRAARGAVLCLWAQGYWGTLRRSEKYIILSVFIQFSICGKIGLSMKFPIPPSVNRFWKVIFLLCQQDAC